MSKTNEPASLAELVSITEVERQTGIRQATLRMWEKRYGFPCPLRDRHGDRVYPIHQVERLLVVRRLMDQGARPGKIFSGAALETVGGEQRQPDAGAVPAGHAQVFDLLRQYRRAELYSHFQYRLLDLGLRRFVIECLAPLSEAVGLAWSRGELPVRCEHLFTQLALSVLHAKQAAVRTAAEGRPKILLATLTGEQHALGIMMAEAVMTSLGANCIQLGSEAPPLEVAAAAREAGADIVALSFSIHFPSRNLLRIIQALRASLPGTSIWLGGAGVPPSAALGQDIEVFDTLDAIEPALLRWRSCFDRQPTAVRARPA